VANNASTSGFIDLVSVQTEDFDLTTEVNAMRAADARVGAVCCFVGTVRELNEERAVATMELEHYPGMTERSIGVLIDEARQRFDIYRAKVIHRIGKLKPLDQIVLVAVTAAHRGASFQACEFLMDRLKTEAPFWKKEITAEGYRWVDARRSDELAVAHWRKMA
jgi:molybdopterin synthase catalytic subunit